MPPGVSQRLGLNRDKAEGRETVEVVPLLLVAATSDPLFLSPSA